MNFNFDLNDNSLLNNSSIFNGGEPGRVTNCTFRVEDRSPESPSSHPICKFFYTDPSGASVNEGYFTYTKDERFTEEQNMKNFRNKLSKLLPIAKTLVPADFKFPNIDGLSTEQIENMLINTIKNNVSPEKKVNVFVNYGTTKKPDGYLRVRYDDFIEPAFVSEEQSKLKVKKGWDNMERVMPDNTNATPANTGFGTPTPAPSTPDASSFWASK